MRRAVFLLAGAGWLALAVIPACSSDYELDNTAISCAADGDCPASFTCSADKTCGYCPTCVGTAAPTTPGALDLGTPACGATAQEASFRATPTCARWIGILPCACANDATYLQTARTIYSFETCREATSSISLPDQWTLSCDAQLKSLKDNTPACL